MLRVFSLSLACLVALVSMNHAYAAGNDSANANATIEILQDLTITKDRDLAFNDAFRGDAAETISAGDAESAQFSLTGGAAALLTLTLPANGSVSMTTGGGGANETIAVDNFSHNAGGVPALDGTGALTFEVGAQRAAIGAAQVYGSYTGSFTVQVAYQ